MRAQLGLQLGLVLRSQRAFPLLVVLLIVPAVTVPAGGSVTDDYQLVGILALPITAMMTLTSTGHPALAQSIMVAAGGRRRIAFGSVIIAMAFAVLAGAVLSVAPYALGGSGSVDDWRSGSLLLTSCTGTAAACALLAARQAGHRPATAFLICLAALVLAAAVPGVGPVRVALDAENEHTGSTLTLLMTAARSLALIPVAALAATAPGDADA